jgi:hypothetical protein
MPSGAIFAKVVNKGFIMQTAVAVCSCSEAGDVRMKPPAATADLQSQISLLKSNHNYD